jgi:hypothetical protein
MTLNAEQTSALKAIIEFLGSDAQIFILRGYAGTGKTTLLKSLLEHFKSSQEKRPLRVFAPTGRAAKILQEKAGIGLTIHKGIYAKATESVSYKNNEDQEECVDAEGQNNKLIFKLKTDLQHCRPIIIADEASMISAKTAPDDRIQFGTDNLLEDLLTYAGINCGGQIIFVGDDAQLPPVTDNTSAALSQEYFISRNLSVRSATLTHVMRQGTGSLILKNAMMIRDNIFKERKDRLCQTYSYKDNEFSSIAPSNAPIEAARNYANTIIISYTNAAATRYNAAIRKIIFPDQIEPVPGDRLLIVRNSYNGETALFNGEFCDLIEVADEEVRYAFVGHRRIELKFRNVKLRHESGSIIDCKIITNLLGSASPNLSEEESKALFSEFVNRHPHLRKKEFKIQFLDALHKDPYFNAIQVKYGYAITCHKAQGGEWENVIVDFNGRNGQDTESLRWTYTALTRATKHLMVENLALSTPLFKMRILETTKARSMDSDCRAVEDADIPQSTPFHTPESKECKRIKFANVQKLLKPGEEISDVRSKDYQEIYMIKIGDNIFRYDTYHNNDGVFKPFELKTTKSNSDATDLLLRLNTVQKPKCRYSYTPASTTLEYLDQIVQECAAQANLLITNIVDHPSQYFVNYYFFSSNYHKIQFSYTKKGDISTATPSTIGNVDDAEFRHFLSLLESAKQN